MEESKYRPGSIGLVLSIALPMIISQSAETMMLFCDRYFLSSLGREHLSGAMAGGMMGFTFMTFFLGIIGYVTALTGQFYGAKRERDCGKAGAQGILLAILSWPIIMGLIPVGLFLLNNAGHDEYQAELEQSYYFILTLGSVFALLRSAFSSFFSGIGRTRIVMCANMFAMLVNVLMNYLLIFGHWGFPALGMQGAAIGTILGSAAGAAVLGLIYFSKNIDERYNTRSSFRYYRDVFSKLMKFGVPGGVEFFLTMSAFNFFIQLLHSYGKDAAAAVTITFNWDIVSFLPLTGLNIAVTSLAGRYKGANSEEGVVATVKSGLKISILYGLIMTIFFVCIPEQMTAVFTSGNPAEYSNVVPIAVTLLRLASIYIIADGIQLVFGGALRGVGDTRWLMFITVICHWVVAWGGYTAAKIFNVKVEILWGFFIFLICLMAIVLGLRLKSGRWKAIKVFDDK